MSERRWGRQLIHRARVDDLPHSTLTGPGLHGGLRSRESAIRTLSRGMARNPASDRVHASLPPIELKISTMPPPEPVAWIPAGASVSLVASFLSGELILAHAAGHPTIYLPTHDPESVARLRREETIPGGQAPAVRWGAGPG